MQRAKEKDTEHGIKERGKERMDTKAKEKGRTDTREALKNTKEDRRGTKAKERWTTREKERDSKEYATGVDIQATPRESARSRARSKGHVGHVEIGDTQQRIAEQEG